MVKTAEEVKNNFRVLGISIAEWCRLNSFSAPICYQLLSGKKKGIRGQSHQIAVALGLKEGVIGDINDLSIPGKTTTNK